MRVATGQAIKHSAMRPLAQTTRRATPTATAPHPPATPLPRAATSGAVTTSRPAAHAQAPRPAQPAPCRLPSPLPTLPASQRQTMPPAAPSPPLSLTPPLPPPQTTSQATPPCPPQARA
jgi:hypothetical protein